jgi:TonB family protein
MSNNFSLILTKKRIKMITRNEKAKGLWWRLLATLPVLAILMIANTKVTAQEKQVNPNPPVDTDTYQIVMYEYDDEDRIPVNDTVMMNEDGSYTEIKREPEVDPETGKMRTKVSFATYDKEGKPAPGGFHIKSEPGEGDGVVYHITPQQGFRFPAEPDNDSIYQVVDEMPKFPGGEQAMMDFVAKNVKYPQEARDKEISGRVYVSFVVEKDGSVSNVKVVRGIGGGCDEEAARVIKGMPKWKSGMQKGKPVRVNYMMPIFFKLDGGKSNSNSLVGTIWEGIGTGTKGDVTYTWHSTMQFSSENEGFLIEKFVSQKKGADPVVEFENVAMDFEYAFDGKKTGAITPKNGDGTYMDELPPEGFVLSDDGKTLILNFYTATEETGIKYVNYTRK